MFLNKKDNLITFIKYMREYIQDESFENMYALRNRVRRLCNSTYFNKEFNIGITVFKFDYGFEIELTDDELDFVINVLFYEVDLMSQNTEVEIKKEEDICFKNIWHFDKDLFEFFKNGDVNRLHTMINYFKEEGREIYEETCETNDVVNALMKKCTYINENDEYVYKFDNGIQFALNDDDLETIAIVIVDAY